MSSTVTFDIRTCDPPTIRWGKHAKNAEISRIFNDLFSFELPDEAWHELFINTTTSAGGDFDPSQAVIPADIVTRVRTAIGTHILLPVATDTPGDEAAMLLAYKQILDLCPLYIGYSNNVMGNESRTRLTDKTTFQNFMKRVCSKMIFSGIFIEVSIQAIHFPEDLSGCNYLEWTDANLRTDRAYPTTVRFGAGTAPAAPVPVALVSQPLTTQAITAAVSAALAATPPPTAHGNSVMSTYPRSTPE